MRAPVRNCGYAPRPTEHMRHKKRWQHAGPLDSLHLVQARSCAWIMTGRRPRKSGNSRSTAATACKNCSAAASPAAMGQHLQPSMIGCHERFLHRLPAHGAITSVPVLRAWYGVRIHAVRPCGEPSRNILHPPSLKWQWYRRTASEKPRSPHPVHPQADMPPHPA